MRTESQPTARGSGATLEFGRAFVTKRQASNVARLELIKTVAARRVGEKTGLFEVPAISFHAVESGVIVFDRVQNGTSLQTSLAVMSDAARAKLTGRLGLAIAAIHNTAPLPDEPCMESLERLPCDPRTAVFVHGDFCLANILVRSASSRPVILDWASAPWLGRPFANADAIVDLASFALSLFARRPFEPFAVRDPKTLCASIFNAYASVRPMPSQNALRARVWALWARMWRTPKGPRERLATLARYPYVLRALWAIR